MFEAPGMSWHYVANLLQRELQVRLDRPKSQRYFPSTSFRTRAAEGWLLAFLAPIESWRALVYGVVKTWFAKVLACNRCFAAVPATALAVCGWYRTRRTTW